MWTTTTFLAVPDEALFIGPPRSQVKGEAHHAETIFPPPPSTFQGAVRTRILMASGVSLDDKAAIQRCVGTSSAMPSGWQLAGPWVAEVQDGTVVPWVPLPACAGSRGGLWSVCGTRPRGDILLDGAAPPELPDAAIVAALSDRRHPHWIDARALFTLLAGGATPLDVGAKPPFADETRVGLQIDDATRGAQRANLYFRRTVRLGRSTGAGGLLGSLEVPDGDSAPTTALTTGWLNMGRRHRPLALQPAPPIAAAWQDVVSGAHLDEIEPADGALFWLVLASPVSLPDERATGTPARPRLPDFSGCRADVVAAVHLPPVVIGGLDLATRRSKPNRAFLMPGTAWGVRITGGGPDERRTALRALHHRCTLGPAEDRPFGFGRTWIARPHMETS